MLFTVIIVVIVIDCVISFLIMITWLVQNTLIWLNNILQAVKLQLINIRVEISIHIYVINSSKPSDVYMRQ